ncbi:hypothetical protein EDD22DRAFT_1052210 [Suillus occidentalis]|nr:hypothetical protein EDD22DRAFT_1052210 [Suillus occidentalis]
MNTADLSSYEIREFLLETFENEQGYTIKKLSNEFATADDDDEGGIKVRELASAAPTPFILRFAIAILGKQYMARPVKGPPLSRTQDFKFAIGPGPGYLFRLAQEAKLLTSLPYINATTYMIALYISEKAAISIAALAKQPTSTHHIWSRRSRCVLVGTMKRSWNVKASCIKTEIVCNVTFIAQMKATAVAAELRPFGCNIATAHLIHGYTQKGSFSDLRYYNDNGLQSLCNFMIRAREPHIDHAQLIRPSVLQSSPHLTL